MKVYHAIALVLGLTISANGFVFRQTTTTQSHFALPQAGAPLAAPQTAVSTTSSTVIASKKSPLVASRSPRPLYMADVSSHFQDVGAGSASGSNNDNNNNPSPQLVQQKTTSTSTQLRATAGEMIVEPDLDLAYAEADYNNIISIMPKDNDNNSNSNFLQQKMQELDINEIINTSVVVILSLAMLTKLTMVDAGMTRGWSTAEIAERIAADNWFGYMHILQSNPIATKAATSATVYTIGDVIAQRTGGASMGNLDRPRILRSMLAGLIGHGPLSHVWYQVSEDFFDNVLHLTQWWSFIPKVMLDQGFWGPIWNNTYILLLGLMKRESLESIWGDVKRTTIPLVVSGLKLWPLAHCVTYGLIPVENRLLWVDMVEIVWVTILASQAAGGGTQHGAPAPSSNDDATAARTSNSDGQEQKVSA